MLSPFQRRRAVVAFLISLVIVGTAGTLRAQNSDVPDVSISSISTDGDQSTDDSPDTTVKTTTSASVPKTSTSTPGKISTSASSSSSKRVKYTYSVKSKGAIQSNLESFATRAATTFADPRGWSLGGSMRFERVDAGGDFTLWLAAPDTMASFSGDCSTVYSCRVGRNVVINDARWANGSSTLALSVDAYHDLVVNHEVGHWLGLDHRTCEAPGGPAYVMQQQSKGGTFMGGCTPNAWPRSSERQTVANARGLQILG